MGKAIKASDFSKREKLLESQGEIDREWVMVRLHEIGRVQKEWKFQRAVTECAERVCGLRRIGRWCEKSG